MSYIIKPETISITEASNLTNISPKSLIKKCINEVIIPVPPISAKTKELLLNNHLDREELTALSDSTQIPLDQLPKYAILEHRRARATECLLPESLELFNLSIFRKSKGFNKLISLGHNVSILRSIVECDDYSTDPQKSFVQRINQNGLSISTYYKELNKMYQLGLLSKVHPKKHFSICPMAADIIKEHCFYLNHCTDGEILEDLTFKKNKLGKQFCSVCPHNPKTKTYKDVLNEFTDKYPSFHLQKCLSPEDGLIIPTNSSTINRFIHNIDPSLLFLAQNEKNTWEAKYGYKLRRYCSNVNEVWFCDFVKLDILLTKYYDENGDSVLERPWACIITDAASSMIVSAIVRFGVPTTEDVIMCFSVGAVHKTDSIAYGLPLLFYTDNGWQFKPPHNTKGNKSKKKQLDKGRLNREAEDLFEKGFLPALGVEMRFQKPYSPWQKPIESLNRTIQYKFLKRLPGWTGGKKYKKHKERLQLEMERLKKYKAFWDIDKFQRFFFEQIIPGCNNIGGENSPIERYNRLPRANTLVPSWASISILMQRKVKLSVKISQGSIRYKNSYYSSPELFPYEGKNVWIYDFGSIVTKCISVLYSEGTNIHFVGLAYEKEQISIRNPEQMKLLRELSLKHMQYRMIENEQNAVTYLNEMVGTDRKTYIDYIDHKIIPTHYTNIVDHSNKDCTHIDKELLKAYIAEQKEIISALEKEL